MRMLALIVGMNKQRPRRLWIVMIVLVPRCLGLMIKPSQVRLVFGLLLVFLFDLGGHVGCRFQERRVEPY